MKHFNRNILKLTMLFLMAGSLMACNSNRSDSEIQNDIQEKLTSAEGNNAAYGGVTATVNDGVVTLTGQCEGENCADSVVNRVEGIDGVKEVVNNVTVGQSQADLTLRTSVQTIISKYQGVQADVVNGEVVLRGTIQRDQVQPLMTELKSLNANKIDNQLAVQ